MNVIRFNRCRTLSSLDKAALELANRGHVWTHEERRTYDRRVRELSK